MGKKKKLPPRMEEAKDAKKAQKTLCNCGEVCKDLSKNFLKLCEEVEKFRLSIMSYKNHVGNYYDSIKHDSKDSHADYQILVEVDKAAAQLLEAADELGEANNDYISRKSTNSSNEVCDDSSAV